MKKNIKTAVIGVGNMGKNHARIYSEISDLVAVSDVIENTGKKIAEKYKVKFYKDFHEMLQKEKPDAVSVVVPTKFHKEITIDCLKREIPTLVEKPIADTLSDAKAMLEEAKKNRTFLMVGHIERFNPVVVRLKDLIDQRKFGRIISLLAIRVGISPPKISGSDVIIDLAIHDLDVFNYLLDELPHSKKIIGSKIFKDNRVDSAAILLEYKHAIGMIQTNWITPIKMRKLYLTGTDGFAEVDYISQKLVIHNNIINKKQVGDYLELISLSRAQKKEIYISRKEPLKNELLFFLKNRKNYQHITITTGAIEALRLVIK